MNLDEIGLAESSPSMPLKALHGLLDANNTTTTSLSVASSALNERRVSVIGISNWALDPAKMNRALFVTRGEPSVAELIHSAKGIMQHDRVALDKIAPHMAHIADAYLEVCEAARRARREFFGLRDYYSLVKMLYALCSNNSNSSSSSSSSKNIGTPALFDWPKLEYAVRRNLGGMEELGVDCLAPFRRRLAINNNNKSRSQFDTSAPSAFSALDLLESALRDSHAADDDEHQQQQKHTPPGRYILLLTETSSAVDTLKRYLLELLCSTTSKSGGESSNAVSSSSSSSLVVLYASSFRGDQHDVEIYRNISVVKHAMELGKTLVLLNSYTLYESLYDALNQYYYEFAGQRYVDIGLGTHRVKCQVHERFRLVVIAEPEAAYDQRRFPIPLLNRLEKHALSSAMMLSQAGQSSDVQFKHAIHIWLKQE